MADHRRLDDLPAALAAALLALPAYAADVNTWRYTSGSNMVNGEYAPGALGFNLADVSSLANLNRPPDGVKGLVYIGTSAGGCTSNSAQFRAFVEPNKDKPKLWGFYLMDEPYAKQVGLIPPCPMENLEAETEYVHAKLPGLKPSLSLATSAPPRIRITRNGASK